MSQIHLKIVTPQKTTFDDHVDEVMVTTGNGEIGILPEHINLMTQIVPGEVRIKQGNKQTSLVTGSGLLQVAADIVTITTDMAEHAESIDEKAAEDVRKRALEALEQTTSDEEIALAGASLERALAQLKVKRRHRVR